MATEFDPFPPAAAADGSARYSLPPVHPDGIKFVVAAFAIACVGFWLWSPLGWLLTAVLIWVIAFFRDPARVTPTDPAAIVAPADGFVSRIATVPLPAQLVGEGGLPGAQALRISIFMSVFDVHVNRAPFTGILRRIVYVPGKFLNASLDKASDNNERQYFVIEGQGVRVGFCQIAGLIARRIVKFVAAGDAVACGQRFGLIRFGSRLDVYLPHGAVVGVRAGQRAVAGETVLARLAPLANAQ